MDQKEFEATLVNAEARLKRLRVLYDQWFMGIERVEPQTQRRDIERTLTRLRTVQIRNTALRFRFNQFLQRYTTYSTYWKRVTRQIEEGTYKRDVLRARRLRPRGTSSDVSARSQQAFELDLDNEIDVDVDAALDAVMRSEAPPTGQDPWPAESPPSREITPFAMPNEADGAPARTFSPPKSPLPRGGAAPVAPPPLGALRAPRPPPPAGRPPPPPPPPAGRGNGVSDDQIRNIFDRYVQARRSNAERTDNVKLETIAKSVRQMMPKLEQKHAGKKIDFEVVVRNGKVALKPVPKKG